MNNSLEACAGFETEFKNQLMNALQENSLSFKKSTSYPSDKRLKPSTELIQKAHAFGFNCDVQGYFFFQALILQLRNGTGLYHCLSAKELMKIVIKHVVYGYQPTHSGNKNFIHNLLQNGLGLNHLIISILASALDVSIILLNSDKPKPCYFKERNPIMTIYLGYDADSQQYYALNRNVPPPHNN